MMKKLPHLIDGLYGGNGSARPKSSSNCQLIKEASFILDRLSS
jgi:hypothetical protein